MKFPITDFFSKSHQICRKKWIWSHLLKKSVMKTSFFVQCNLRKNVVQIFRNYFPIISEGFKNI